MSGNLPVRLLEIACWVVGSGLMALYAVARVGGEFERDTAISDFERARSASIASAHGRLPDRAAPLPVAVATTPAIGPGSKSVEPVDRDNLPIALLRIPRVALDVPVFSDTSERNLNRGAGWIVGTATPEGDGNMAIAAHRDGYFGALEYVEVNDVLELQSLTQSRTYRVTAISVVQPEDLSPLHPTDSAAITLVTCYPFHFVGHAAQRYIVRAVATP